MKRRFNFFKWASGKSSAKSGRKRTEARKLGLLVLTVLGLILLSVVARHVFHSEAEENAHPHEKGPHGGIVKVLNPDEPHYHAEFVFEDDGRFAVFFWEKGMEVPKTLPARPVNAELHTEGKESATSVVLRPANQNKEGKTTELVGRFSADLLGKGFVLVISRLIIENQVFSVQAEVPEISEEMRARILDLERKLTLNPNIGYTLADIEANGRMTPSEKYRNLQVSHSLEPVPADERCPVTGIRADSRIGWVVGGQTYHFCCAPCILDFVLAAKEMPGKMR